MTGSAIENLQEAIDYHFRNPALLTQALTHSSFLKEAAACATDTARDNEQLEFLGDAVMGFIVSVKLADAFPDSPEGKLSRARSSLVATDHLGAVAASLCLGDYLRLGHGEEKTGGRSKSRLAVNALEAIVAAIYRDGGLAAAEEFITRFILPEDIDAAREQLFTIDYKSALQEYLQAGRLRAAAYRIVAENGPEHRKIFAVEVSAAGGIARGQGVTKRLAEQEAARNRLEMMERNQLADE